MRIGVFTSKPEILVPYCKMQSKSEFQRESSSLYLIHQCVVQQILGIKFFQHKNIEFFLLNVNKLILIIYPLTVIQNENESPKHSHPSLFLTLTWQALGLFLQPILIVSPKFLIPF